jgi:hypothetical protein
MNWYKKIIFASEHSDYRIQTRLAENSKEIENLVKIAQYIYSRFGRGGSYAVNIMQFDEATQVRDPIDGSNGDWAVAVLRPTGPSYLECSTVMLRRSPDRIMDAQPFTPEALRVDYVVTYNDFLSHMRKFLAKQKSQEPQPQPQEVQPEETLETALVT